MATSRYFNHTTNKNEQDFFEDLIVESIQIGGHDIYYIPRTVVEQDEILGETVQSTFGRMYLIEVYFKNIDSYSGDGEIMSKFGLMINDDLSFNVSRKRFNEELGDIRERPREGDLIFIGDVKEPKDSFMNSIFQITYVSQLEPFWQLGRTAVYSINCQRYAYGSETFDTGEEAIDGMFADIDENDDSPQSNIDLQNQQDEIQDFNEDNPFGNF